MNFYQKLVSIIEERRIYKDEPMRLHTTFRVGGPADFFVCPNTIEEVRSLIQICEEENMPYYILGNGSNLLVGDKGYRGVVIQIYKEMNGIQVEGEHIKVQAGALLSRIGNVALESELTGFEFAAGIPGTIGGAVVMNAGAYGGEMKDVLETVTVLCPNGEIKILENEELELGYRTSIIAKKDFIVLEAVVKLSRGDKEAIRERMNELKIQRR